MKDSPAACTTVGLDLTRTKVEVFALAAAIAGIGGFLLAGWKGNVGKDDFSLLTGALSALPVLLLAVVGGITAVSGAMIGALLLVAMPQVAARLPVARRPDDPVAGSRRHHAWLAIPTASPATSARARTVYEGRRCGARTAGPSRPVGVADARA